MYYPGLKESLKKSMYKYYNMTMTKYKYAKKKLIIELAYEAIYREVKSELEEFKKDYSKDEHDYINGCITIHENILLDIRKEMEKDL